MTNSSRPSVYDLSVIAKYLDFLGWGEDNPHFTFAFFDKGSTKPLGSGLSTQYLTKEAVLDLIPTLNTTNFTLHVCLNETFPDSRKLRDIKAPRVLCVDIDRWLTPQAVIETTFPYIPPHAMTVSSLKGEGRDQLIKAHLYWKIEPGISLMQWSHLQVGLAHLMEGDKHLGDLNKTIRVPGVERSLKDGGLFTPTFSGRDEYTPLSLSDIEHHFKGIFFAAKLAQKKMKSSQRLEHDIFSKAWDDQGKVQVDFKPHDIKKLVDQYGRNQTLFNLGKRYFVATFNKRILKPDECVYQLVMFAERLDKCFGEIGAGILDFQEIKKTVDSIISRTLPYLKKQKFIPEDEA